VDIGGTKNKYVGQSEQNMLTNLMRLDHEEPAVALLDEVEKVFASSNTDSSGTTSTMLSQLLWWLAERQSRVLVIMTTNNAKALPKELYREGRVDQAMMFNGLTEIEAQEFVSDVLKTFKEQTDLTIMKLKTQIIKECFPPSVGAKPLISQAALTKVVYSFVKSQYATPG
jgi:SpoVK/Ycf46/Vps4 family AAA+-type ATPase